MSTQIVQRFPTNDHLVEAGLVTDSELTPCILSSGFPAMDQVEIGKAKDAGLISSDLVFIKLQESLQDLEVKNKSLLGLFQGCAHFFRH